MADMYTLPRDGQRPVRFTGELLAEERGGWTSGKDQNRYYNVSLYHTESGKYLVHWEYVTRWQGEEQHNKVEDFGTQDAAMEALEQFDSLEWVQGYKHLLDRRTAYEQAQDPSEYAKRQADLERQIRERYAAQVAALCATLGIVEEL